MIATHGRGLLGARRRARRCGAGRGGDGPRSLASSRLPGSAAAPGRFTGTPLPKDEPKAANPRSAPPFYYLLRAAPKRAGDVGGLRRDPRRLCALQRRRVVHTADPAKLRTARTVVRAADRAGWRPRGFIASYGAAHAAPPELADGDQLGGRPWAVPGPQAGADGRRKALRAAARGAAEPAWCCRSGGYRRAAVDRPAGGCAADADRRGGRRGEPGAEGPRRADPHRAASLRRESIRAAPTASPTSPG